jgi:hypothetical protein
LDQRGIADRLSELSKRYEESRPGETEETAPFHLPSSLINAEKLEAVASGRREMFGRFPGNTISSIWKLAGRSTPAMKNTTMEPG